jgi:hypothetical protein
MGGNEGYKSVKRANHRIKSKNFNKPGKAEQHTDDIYGCWCGREKYKEYVNQEFGIKFKTQDTDFTPGGLQISNMDTSHMTEEEIVHLNGKLYTDFHKNVPSDWEHFHDKTRWRTEKNRAKGRRRDSDMKLDR